MAATVTLAPTPARAACTISGGGTIQTCTGDESGGVAVNNGSGGTIGTLDVNSLTTNITPPSGTNGLRLTSQGVNGSDGSDGSTAGSAGHPNPGIDLLLTYTQPGANVSVSNSGAIITTSADGIFVRSQGGHGGDGGDATGAGNDGHGGTNGGAGGDVTIQINGAISASGNSLPAIVAASIAGYGGNGGDSASGNPGNGGAGGVGGNVSVTASGTIVSTGDDSGGINAISRGGAAGTHGGCTFDCGNTHTGASAAGGQVTVTTTAGTSITTDGEYANGIYATSIGGFGATGAASVGIVAYASNGTSGGPGGLVTVMNAATITTLQEGSYGIFAQSIGGGGGGGGSAGGIVSVGGHGAAGGPGGQVVVNNSGIITTSAEASIGIFAQSVGGSGGDGGKSAGISSVGGNGAGTSDGDTVVVTNTALISTQGASSQGIFAQSIGGGGGNGGRSVGLSSVGGSGGGGGDGELVTVTNSGVITTAGDSSQAILAQSIGGGGGHGGASAAVFSVGGSGGAGGAANTATLTNSGNLSTLGSDSSAILVQSIGGGGGNGGSSAAINANAVVSISHAVGGKGGVGGAGGMAELLRDGSNTAYSVTTAGERSTGILVQSIGGGGGNGGMAIAVSDGGSYNSSSALGGTGGAGGSAMAVTVQTAGTVATTGDYSDGVFAQSLGGGGGNGGMAISVSNGGALTATVAIGGDGGAGGNANTVNVSNWSAITTAGQSSNGLVAQSIGGGGGNGGNAFSLAAGGFTIGVGLGGKGANGGFSGAVVLDSTGSITTTGAMSDGIFAQSVGGGGGNGGSSVTLSGGLGAVSLSLGGAAAGGNYASTVDVTNSGAIATSGDHSVGIFAQSVGGGGGNGGYAVSGSAGVMSAAIAVGGKGGAGSHGDAVTVGNTGVITTLGDYAFGIQAQSIGGGGGNGGFALSGAIGVQVDDIPGGAVAISVGGRGGGASNASTVTLTNSGNIGTAGLNAHAIFAQSVGGGGGSGGFAGSVAMTIGSGASFAVAVGGGGSGGGDAAAVSVTNTAASIVTQSDGANGIFAQSVGGGGGDGGFGFSGSFGFAGETSVNVAVAIGGAGGAGGTGSTVEIDNQGAISTSGMQSSGIFAQSVGGGGGNGGMAMSGTLNIASGCCQTGVSVGGSGGSGGTADNVTVTNAGAISTAGMDSIGIFAQSVGGSGGNGGMAMTAQFTGTTQDTAAISVAVGGGGGDGNSAGEVEVTNTIAGTINTSGFGGHGIQAQSVGGGGGNGGMALSAQLGVNPAGGYANQTLNVGIAVGGAGGNGGIGNVVHVINDGSIAVGGDTAMGIFAQSVGGGGGNGGGAVSAYGAWVDTSNTTSRSLNINVAIGGAGGNGNHGGAVTVENSGSIMTEGVSGYGVYAQSVGGGGGIGGRANTFSLVTTNACTTPILCPSAPTFSNFFSLGLALGGNGGGASHGGAVTVNNTGAIQTFGDSSDGIFAQSVGGGGGNGGNGTIGLTGVIPPQAGAFVTGLGLLSGAVSFYQNLQVAVGGNNGSSGDGGAVLVDNNKNITTHGATSNAITAQSVGGGGGIGGNAAIGLTGLLGVGGKGGAGGNGGDVTVNQHGGATIETFGVSSYGIFAQSVGGGGGVGGSVSQFATPEIDVVGLYSVPSFNAGIGLTVGQGGGSGGNGGHVQVTTDGTVRTHGDNAFGIFAQSVGGGGGASGQLGSLIPWALGGNGDAGDAGAVDVTLNGTILTSGNNATGIFAQSAGGQGVAANVTVTLNSTIMTGAILGSQDGTASAPLRGLGSIGIFAQSVASSNANNGDIIINLNSADGVVQGGRTQLTTPTSGSIGVGIWLQDGNNNIITNRGLVTTLGGVNAGYAILATGSDGTHLGGNETVNNFGTITGSVDLGAGANAFNNNAGAFFNPGVTAFMGAGNTLTNAGTVSPGGLTTIMTTAATGNFVQSAAGTYAFNIDFLPNTADRIDVTGTAAIAGTAALNPLNPGNAQPGNHKYTILTSAGGTTHTGLALTAPSSAVVSYALTYPNANDVVVGYDVNFRPAGLPSNLISIGNAVNNIQTAGVPGFAPIAAALFDLPNTESLIQAYNTLGGSGTAATQQSAFGAGQLFTSSMLDQAALWLGGGTDTGGVIFTEEAGGPLQYAASRKRDTATRKRALEAFAQIRPAQPDRWRAWMAAFGGKQNFDGNAAENVASQSQTTYGGGFGVDRQMNRDFLFGFGVGGSRSSFTVPDRATDGTLDGGHLGVYGMMRRNAWYVAGSLSYARFDNETHRTISGVGPAENARGKFTSDQLSGRLEVGRRSNFGRFAVTPFTALEFAQLWQRGYTETSTLVSGGGPGILGLTYESQATTSVPVSLGVTMESSFRISNGMLFSPFARVAWVHELQPDRQVTPSFNVAPGFTFTSTGVSAASDLARVNLGASLSVTPQASVFAAVSGEFASNVQSYGVTGGFRVGW